MAFIDILKKAFPFISTAAALGGPLGEIGALALGNAIGADVKPGDLTAKISALSTTEQGRIQLDAAEKNFQLTMAKMGFDDAESLAKIAADDRSSARQMQTQTRSVIPAILATFVTLGFFGILAAMFKYSPPQSAHDALMLMLGALGSAWISVISYYFGDSQGRADQQKSLNDIAAK